ncbi:MAG: hypothetical protein ABJG28_01950 [Nonlabens ulvanivorans]|uniref:hypothetical protein n=1 Tax=Nonlabens ulvanivorans TaxID=906888 RepID=UPI0032679E0B
METCINMKKTNHFLFILVALFLISGCVTSPIVMNKIKMKDQDIKLDTSVLLFTDNQLLTAKHQEKQLGTTFEYDIGFYLKNATHDSLKTIFTNIALSESLVSQDKFDLVIKPILVSFTAPVPALVLMSTKTEVTINYEVIPQTPLKPYTLTATGTYELLDEEDEKIYSSLTSKDIYTYNAVSNFGMHVPDYSYEAGKDAYMAIYHALKDLNSQLLIKLNKTN